MLLPIQRDDKVQDFVYQPHRVDLSGFHGLLWESDQIPLFVHLLGEHPSGVEVGEYDVSAHREQWLIEIVSVSCASGDVEFHTTHL